MLRDRASKLGAASLQISAGLDRNSVLDSVLLSVPALTAGRSGSIADLGHSGKVRDHVTTSFTSQIALWGDRRSQLAGSRTKGTAVKPGPALAWIVRFVVDTCQLEGRQALQRPACHSTPLVRFFLS